MREVSPVDIESSGGREEILCALTGGLFSNHLCRGRQPAACQWMDAALDMVDWRAVKRRDAAACALVNLSSTGDMSSRGELLRLLAEGPPHVRIALVRALPDEIDYPILAAAWKGSQQNFWRGSARFEKILRRLAITLACVACIGLVAIQIAAVDQMNVKELSDFVLGVVAAAAVMGVLPYVTAWLRFPCRHSWRSSYYLRLSELLQLETASERSQCLALLPEVGAMSELMNGDFSYLGKHFRETEGMIRSAAERRSSFPIPAESRDTGTTVLPIPVSDLPCA
jgi:hypothetical protein